jgi:predicted nuclease of predicted toxin-antitoxin system
VRLLFDENLSERLVGLVADVFPDSLHIRTLGFAGASDRDVWRLAAEHGCLLVTRDEDFLELSTSLGSPPKVVWVSPPNPSTASVADLLRRHQTDIEQFSTHEDAGFLVLR